MSPTSRATIVLLLVCAVVGVLAAKRRDRSSTVTFDWAAPEAFGTSTKAAAGQEGGSSRPVPLPTLVDLGAGKCVACKMMVPVLDELRTEFAGTFDVDFVDVWENPDAGEEYGIRLIPTQIFYDAEGNELFRHEGFYGRDDIVSKWKAFGVVRADGPEAQ